MYRLLARVLRERDQVERRWPQTIAAALDLLIPSLFAASEAWQRRTDGGHLVAHIEALWAAVDSAPDGAASISDLVAENPLDDAGHSLLVRLCWARLWAVRQLTGAADLGGAIDAGTTLLTDRADLFGPGDRLTLAVREALAIAHKLAGHLPKARGLYEQNLDDRRVFLGNDHPDTLETLNNYGELHLSLRQPDEAAELFKQALRGRERVLPPGDYAIFESRVNLAAAMTETGQLAEAIQLAEQTLAERLASVGSEHENTLFVRGNLAYKYWKAGRLDKAIALNEEIYIARRALLGDDHRIMLVAATNLAACYAQAGELDKALALHKDTFDTRLATLGPGDPETLRSRHALALTYAAMGSWDEAIELHEVNLAARRHYLAEDHPHAQDTISALVEARSAAHDDPAPHDVA
jgi:tetratricopeptide (TPR) repeat protein